MNRRIFVRDEAQADIREAAKWYEDREPGLGISFIRELRLSLQHITNNPLMFPVIEHEVRRAVLHKFPYSTYFIEKPDAVVIIAVLHQQRRPRPWKSRR